MEVQFFFFNILTIQSDLNRLFAVVVFVLQAGKAVNAMMAMTGVQVVQASPSRLSRQLLVSHINSVILW